MLRTWFRAAFIVVLVAGPFCPFSSLNQAHAMGPEVDMGVNVQPSHVHAAMPSCCVDAPQHQDMAKDVAREGDAPSVGDVPVVSERPFVPVLASVLLGGAGADRYGPPKYERRCTSKRE